MSEHLAVVGGGRGGAGGPGLVLLSPRCSSSLGEVLALALKAFLELMEHGVVSWETLSIPFVRKVGSCSGSKLGQWGGVRTWPSVVVRWSGDNPHPSYRW